ncbi:hypothetical protein ACTSEZ_11285 [Metabacillus sp. JX24]|uniref:hypothetical protein n=1 Tax=Metabacillus sp. JX24 TaxID=3240759 RepID=UPI003510A54E
MNYENMKFPRKNMSPSQKQSIRARLQRKQAPITLMHRFFQIAAAAVLLLGIGLFSVYLANESGRSGEQMYSIDLPQGLDILKSDNGLVFKQGERTVGGAVLSSTEEKQSLEGGAGIFEKKEITNLAYPAERLLQHVKTMTAVQTYHYFLELEDGTVVRVYFHTPYVTEKQAEEAIKTFRAGD